MHWKYIEKDACLYSRPTCVGLLKATSSSITYVHETSTTDLLLCTCSSQALRSTNIIYNHSRCSMIAEVCSLHLHTCTCNVSWQFMINVFFQWWILASTTSIDIKIMFKCSLIEFKLHSNVCEKHVLHSFELSTRYIIPLINYELTNHFMYTFLS